MTPTTESEAKQVGFCESCTCAVVLYHGRWSCICVHGQGGVTRWRKSWTAWEPRGAN